LHPKKFAGHTANITQLFDKLYMSHEAESTERSATVTTTNILRTSSDMNSNPMYSVNWRSKTDATPTTSALPANGGRASTLPQPTNDYYNQPVNHPASFDNDQYFTSTAL
jgi:hypothetical protein